MEPIYSPSPARRVGQVAVVLMVVGVLIYAFVGISQARHEQFISGASAKDLQSELAKQSNDPTLTYSLAYRLERDGRSDEARGQMEKLVQSDPHNVTYLQGLARCASESGNAPEAVETYRKIIELRPNDAASYFSLAEVYASAGLVTEAVKEYDQGAKRDTGISTNRDTWARSLMAKGRDADAWNVLTTSVKANPLQDTAFELLTDAGIKLKRFSELNSLLEDRIKQTPYYPVARFRACLVRIILSQQDDAATLREVESIVVDMTQEGVGQPAIFAQLAHIRVLRNNLAGAESALKRGMKLKADSLECLTELAEVYHREGRTAQEAEVRSRLVKLTGETPELHTLREAVLKQPEDNAARLRLAEGLEKAGKYGEATEAYEEVLQRNPQEPTAAARIAPARQTALEHLAQTSKKALAESPQ